MIMPVRVTSEEVNQFASNYCQALETFGHEVHFPVRDAPQDDPTGRMICEVHRIAMLEADEVHVLWDINSKGSHFDLGMAYALGKKLVPVMAVVEDDPTIKSYWKAVIQPQAEG
jgi:nucleoside 2-deoxyribosyltransferase